jgi:hypothetical protein
VAARLAASQEGRHSISKYGDTYTYMYDLGYGLQEKRNRKQKFSRTTEIKFFRNVADYTMNNQIRNTKVREELNIFNLNAKIIKSISQWVHHMQRMKDEFRRNFIIQPKRKRKLGSSQLRWRDQHTLQENGTDHVRLNPR